MAKLSPTEAARTTGASRRTIYRAIEEGRLTRDPDGRIDTAELLRAGFSLQHPDASNHAIPSQNEVALELSADPMTQVIAALEREAETLRTELAAARERETRLLHLLEEEQKHRHRLLEAGAPASASGPLVGWLQRLRGVRRRPPRQSGEG